MPTDRRRAAAERQRRRRLRERAGLAVLPVEVEVYAVAERLMDLGLLGETDSREALADAISQWIAQSVTRDYADF